MIALAEVAGRHDGEDDDEGEEESPEEGGAGSRACTAEQAERGCGRGGFDQQNGGFEEGGCGKVQEVCETGDGKEEPHNEWRVGFEDLGAVEADAVEHAIGDVETPELVVADGGQEREQDGHARCRDR